MHMIDFHSHVLPGIDDGASSIEETKRLLASQVRQGIATVVATPHFYKHDSIRRFTARRDEALKQVLSACGDEIPKLIAGAEVELYCGLSERERLRQLCIGDTDYMLIEMPFTYWNDWYYKELDQLMMQHGIRPIIAHLDRYINSSNEIRNFQKLFDRNVVIQINTSSLLQFSFRQTFKKLVRSELVMVLGSDCHDSVSRPCTFEAACKLLKRKFGSDYLEQMMERADAILQNHEPE